MARESGVEIIDDVPTDGSRKPIDLQRPEGYNRREALAICRDLGALALAACSGLSPILRDNPHAKGLNRAEQKALEELYVAFQNLERYIDNFEQTLEKQDVESMSLRAAQELEIAIAELGKLIGAGVAVKVPDPSSREFGQAVEYLRKTIVPRIRDKYNALAGRVKSITEIVYVKYIAVLTDDNFEKEVLENDDIYIVMVTADWCPACRSDMPFAAKFGTGGVQGVKIGRAVLEDGDENIINPKIMAFLRPVMGASGMFGYPAYVVFVEGKPVGFTVGTMGSLQSFDRLVEKAREMRGRGTKKRERRIPPPVPEPEPEDRMPPSAPEPDNVPSMPRIRPKEPLIKA